MRALPTYTGVAFVGEPIDIVTTTGYPTVRSAGPEVAELLVADVMDATNDIVRD